MELIVIIGKGFLCFYKYIHVAIQYIAIILFAAVPYEITTFTTNKRSAGTDADVYVVLYGKKGQTKKESLAKTERERKSMFEKGQKDTFRVEVDLIDLH